MISPIIISLLVTSKFPLKFCNKILLLNLPNYVVTKKSLPFYLKRLNIHLVFDRIYVIEGNGDELYEF